MTAVLAALGILVIGRRWVAAAIQMLTALAALASVIFLHHHRTSGGSTGYRPRAGPEQESPGLITGAAESIN